MKKILTISIILFTINSYGQNIDDKIIIIQTSEGNITLHLDGRRAPITVNNFLELIKKDYFNETVFHRVIPNFMIQGGGFDKNLVDLESTNSIPNESGNGLYTILFGLTSLHHLPVSYPLN